MTALSRTTLLEPGNSGLLVIDMQYDCAARGYGKDRSAPAEDYYFSRLENIVVPNIQALIVGCRHQGIEVLYTEISAGSAAAQ